MFNKNKWLSLKNTMSPAATFVNNMQLSESRARSPTCIFEREDKQTD